MRRAFARTAGVAEHGLLAALARETVAGLSRRALRQGRRRARAS
jgi:hypothetical protein